MLLIFDLDGTLIDSSQDLAISMNATREHMGLPLLDPALIFSYVGNGASVLVRRALGPDASDDEVTRALDFFLKFYRKHSLEHTRLYPGIEQAIGQLAADGHTLAVLTNKPQKISADILRALKVADKFQRVLGGDSLPVKKPDPAGIVLLLQELGNSATETAMIGDSAVDVQTARNAGVAAWGVTWGFQPESFRAHPPDVLLESAADLLSAPRQSSVDANGGVSRVGSAH